jgi:hypothetical protein
VQPATLGIFVIFRGRFLFWDLVGASPRPDRIFSPTGPGLGKKGARAPQHRKGVAIMVVEAAVANIVRTLRRAYGERDVELALSLYAEYAEISIVGHASPPDAPEVFRGKAQIAHYLARLYGQGMSHHVGSALQDVVSGEGRISFNVSSESKDGTRKLVAAHSYEVHEGKIVYQTNVEAS